MAILSKRGGQAFELIPNATRHDVQHLLYKSDSKHKKHNKKKHNKNKTTKTRENAKHTTTEPPIKDQEGPQGHDLSVSSKDVVSTENNTKGRDTTNNTAPPEPEKATSKKQGTMVLAWRTKGGTPKTEQAREQHNEEEKDRTLNTKEPSHDSSTSSASSTSSSSNDASTDNEAQRQRDDTRATVLLRQEKSSKKQRNLVLSWRKSDTLVSSTTSNSIVKPQRQLRIQRISRSTSSSWSSDSTKKGDDDMAGIIVVEPFVRPLQRRQQQQHRPSGRSSLVLQQHPKRNAAARGSASTTITSDGSLASQSTIVQSNQSRHVPPARTKNHYHHNHNHQVSSFHSHKNHQKVSEYRAPHDKQDSKMKQESFRGASSFTRPVSPKQRRVTFLQAPLIREFETDATASLTDHEDDDDDDDDEDDSCPDYFSYDEYNSRWSSLDDTTFTDDSFHQLDPSHQLGRFFGTLWEDPISFPHHHHPHSYCCHPLLSSPPNDESTTATTTTTTTLLLCHDLRSDQDDDTTTVEEDTVMDSPLLLLPCSSPQSSPSSNPHAFTTPSTATTTRTTTRTVWGSNKTKKKKNTCPGETEETSRTLDMPNIDPNVVVSSPSSLSSIPPAIPGPEPGHQQEAAAKATPTELEDAQGIDAILSEESSIQESTQTPTEEKSSPTEHEPQEHASPREQETSSSTQPAAGRGEGGTTTKWRTRRHKLGYI